MKSMMKKILSLALCCLMVLSLAACAAEELPQTTPTTNKKKPVQTKPVETDPEEAPIEADYWLELATNGKANYIVVSAKREYNGIAERLSEVLWAKSNVDFTFSEKDNTNLRKIYVGTNPTDVLSDVSELTYSGELAVDKGNGNIYITGYTMQSIESAVDRFLAGFRSSFVTKDETKGNSMRIPNTIFFLHNPEYTVTEPKLLSKDLSEFKIVISSEAEIVERLLMQDLINTIGADTGLFMNSGKDSSAAVDCEIVFGKTTRGQSQALVNGLENDTYVIKSEGNRIYVAYENYVAASDAIAKIRSLYQSKAEGPIDITAVSEASVNDMVHKADESHIRILSTNVLAAGDVNGVKNLNERYGITYKDRARIQARMILDYLPDFIGMQEMQESGNVNGYEGFQHTEFKNALAGEYSMVPFEGYPVSQQWTPIMYRSTVWELKGYEIYDANGSTMHRVQWAVFEKKDDPSIMCALINTHYSSITAELQIEGAEIINGLFDELKAWYGDQLMTFVTGDFNTSYKSQTFNTTTKGTDWDSSHAMTSNKGNVVSTLDYILADKGLVNVEGYRMLKNGHIYMSSDHYPVIADVSIKSK